MKWFALPSWFLILALRQGFRESHPIRRIKLIDDWAVYRTGLFKIVDAVVWGLLALWIVSWFF